MLGTTECEMRNLHLIKEAEVLRKVYGKGGPCLKGKEVHNPNASMAQEGNLHE